MIGFRKRIADSRAKLGRTNEQTAGPSTARFAMKLRAPPLRMTLLLKIRHLPSTYMSMHLVFHVLLCADEGEVADVDPPAEGLIDVGDGEQHESDEKREGKDLEG